MTIINEINKYFEKINNLFYIIKIKTLVIFFNKKNFKVLIVFIKVFIF